eukprot:gene9710-9869_t
MSVVPKGQFDYVSARLEDLENSLAAAVARIEIFRLREKQLLAELATKLQQDLHQGLVKADTGTQTEQTCEAAPQHKTADAPGVIPLSNTSRYITEVDGHLPVMLVSPAGRKTPGSIVITQEYVDFVEVRARIRRHDFRCLSGSGEGSSSVLSQVALGAAATTAMASDAVELAVPRHLVPGVGAPTLSEPSAILASSSSRASSRNPADASADDSADAGDSSLVQGLQHLAAALPPRFQSRPWFLLYSTARHGISLTTLYRRAAGRSPSVLLVRDIAGYVFGAYCTEPWRPAPRFFGTGESFVFQLEVRSALKNDFFQYAQPESLAVGGLGAFAIWLDAELLHGSSGSCGTFGSPSLASREEFKVATVELWGLDS